MTPETHARAKEIFLAACGLPDAEREAHMRSACGGDEELAAEVQKLMRFHRPAPAPNPSVPSQTPGQSGTALPPRFESGEMVAQRYRIVAPLGRGGMGEVYRAEDTRLSQPVALKFLAPGVVHDAAWQVRFEREVRVARTITHPNVCRVYDIGDTAGGPFLSMEYVDGEDLRTLLKRIGRVPQDKAISIAHQLCRGVAAAHAKGVLHRDLKPANVMLDGRGDVRITDFGLAGIAGDFRGMEIRAGTPAYMAPEQLAGREVTVRSDLYSLGLVLYELFTGKPAFSGDTIGELSAAKTSSQVTPPSQLIADVPPAVESIVLRCIDPDPNNRPESALHVLAALPEANVLDAALEAGEVPSPSLVAAAGDQEGLRLPVASAVLGVAIVLIAVVMVLSPDVHPLGNPAIRKPPAALADRARECALAVGDPPVVDEAFGFAQAVRTAEVDDGERGSKPEKMIDSAGSAPVFWYRQAGEYLSTANPLQAVYGNGRVSLEDPPHRAVSDVRVVLDGDGRLLAIDTARSSDSKAETGAATSETAPAAQVEVPDYREQINIARAIIAVVLLCISTPLAVRNLRRGRSDARGAARLATFVFVIRGAAWVLGTHHVPDFRIMFGAMLAALAGGITLAAVTWVFYVALEPYVRRFWPHTLIAWTRLLRGRWGDPLVGAHVLIGAAVGASWAVLFHLDALAPQWLGWTGSVTPRVEDVTEAADGSRVALAYVLHNVDDAIQIAMLVLLLVVLFRAVLGRLAPALACTAVVFAATYFPLVNHGLTTWFLLAFLIGLGTWMLTRFGLVCVITTIFVNLMLLRMPLTFDLRAWYADLSLLALAVCLTPACFGYWNAVHRLRIA